MRGGAIAAIVIGVVVFLALAIGLPLYFLSNGDGTDTSATNGGVPHYEQKPTFTSFGSTTITDPIVGQTIQLELSFSTQVIARKVVITGDGWDFIVPVVNDHPVSSILISATPTQEGTVTVRAGPGNDIVNAHDTSLAMDPQEAISVDLTSEQRTIITSLTLDQVLYVPVGGIAHYTATFNQNIAAVGDLKLGIARPPSTGEVSTIPVSGYTVTDNRVSFSVSGTQEGDVHLTAGPNMDVTPVLPDAKILETSQATSAQTLHVLAANPSATADLVVDDEKSAVSQFPGPMFVGDNFSLVNGAGVMVLRKEGAGAWIQSSIDATDGNLVHLDAKTLVVNPDGSSGAQIEQSAAGDGKTYVYSNALTIVDTSALSGASDGYYCTAVASADSGVAHSIMTIGADIRGPWQVSHSAFTAGAVTRTDSLCFSQTKAGVAYLTSAPFEVRINMTYDGGITFASQDGILIGHGGAANHQLTMARYGDVVCIFYVNADGHLACRASYNMASQTSGFPVLFQEVIISEECKNGSFCVGTWDSRAVVYFHNNAGDLVFSRAMQMQGPEWSSVTALAGVTAGGGESLSQYDSGAPSTGTRAFSRRFVSGTHGSNTSLQFVSL